MSKSELCKKCAHTKVCFKDKNLFGDVFVAGNPMLFDNSKQYEKFKERENRGFPCDDFLDEEVSTTDVVELVRCKDCEHSNPFSDDLICDYWTDWGGISVPEDGFCSNGERRDDAEIH